MVELAGLGLKKPVAPLVLLPPAGFDVSNISFAEPVAINPNPLELIELTAPQSIQSEIAPIALDFVEATIDTALETPDIQAIETLIAPIESALVIIPKPVVIPKVVKKKPPLQKKASITAPNKYQRKTESAPAKAPPEIPDALSERSGSAPAKATVGQRSTGENVASVSVPVKRVRPRYPKRARRRGIEGEVLGSFLINKNGTVDRTSLRIISARPANVFNKVVLKAVRQWKFVKTARAHRSSQRLVFRLDK